MYTQKIDISLSSVGKRFCVAPQHYEAVGRLIKDAEACETYIRSLPEDDWGEYKIIFK